MIMFILLLAIIYLMTTIVIKAINNKDYLQAIILFIMCDLPFIFIVYIPFKDGLL